MRIEPISKPVYHRIDSQNFLYCRSTPLDSSIENLKSRPKKNQLLVFFKTVYQFLKEKWSDLYYWLRSLFVEDKEKDVDYIKHEGASKGEKVCTLIRKGKGTDATIRLGKTYADLADISFPDSKYEIDLPDMLDQLMEGENIEGIRTDNLKGAYKLWNCRLRSNALLNCKINDPDPLSVFVLSVVQMGLKRPSALNELAHQALMRIQRMMIQAIVTEELTEDDFPNRCRARINQLEAQLGYTFNLYEIVRLTKGAGHPELAYEMDKISSRTALVLPPAPMEFEFYLEDLFILMDATKTEIDNKIIQKLPTITFTRTI
ncbi:MAG: hypothetical protein JSS30_03760 [Verrucomicrobia bacterium]|nr:hypothetical protein [Verrucomicrobiota bacterium]